jgi:aldose sugar dehydrogenase
MPNSIEAQNAESEMEEKQEGQHPIIKDPNLQAELLVEGLSWPTSMAFIDNNNILTLEKDQGTVQLISNGILQEEQVLEVDVNTKAERGLLGIAMMNKDAIFLYYTESSEDDDDNDEEIVKNKIYKYQWDDEERLLVNPTLILDLPATPGPDHVGGKMTMGPDNYLYVIIGDVKREGKLQNIVNGPDPDDTGVILRVNPENGSPAPDNPFINKNDSSSSSLNKYYAYGIRNSFGIAFDPLTDTLWQTENGPHEYDEVNVVKPGFNSGWSKVMGPISKSSITENELVNFPNSKYADPVFSWFPSLGITDIEFLNSSKLDKYTYNIFIGDIGDLTTGNLYYFEVNEERTGIKFSNNSRNSSSNNQIVLSDLIADNEEELSETALGTAFGGITDIETGPDGFLYILTLDREIDGEGKIYRITQKL